LHTRTSTGAIMIVPIPTVQRMRGLEATLTKEKERAG